MQTLLQHADWLIAHPLVLYTGIVAIALVALWFLHRATKED